jgi:4-aminobutyrate aminotransferase-like enzyme
MGARLLAGLTAAASGKPNVAQVRGRGLMAAIEFAERGTLKPRPDLTKKLLAGALERHLILLSCGTYGQAVRVIPPLVTTEAEIDQAVSTIGEVLGSLH